MISKVLLRWNSDISIWCSFLESIFHEYITLRGKCPYSESFWSVFSHIWTEYVQIQSKCGEKSTTVFRGHAFKLSAMNELSTKIGNALETLWKIFEKSYSIVKYDILKQLEHIFNQLMNSK